MGYPYRNYQGVFGEQDISWPEQMVHLENIKLTISKFNYEIPEHLHTDLTQLFFIENGSGKLISDGQSFSFAGPCILFVPNGILHGFQFSKDIKGEVLTLATSLFDDCLKGLPDISHYYQDMRYLPFHEELASFDELMSTRLRFHAELKVKRIARQKIIQLLLQILIVRLYRLIVEHVTLEFPNDNRTLSYYNRFLRLVKQQHNNAWTVADYAKELHISSGHLNRVCRNLVNKSALQLIHEQLKRESKKMLLTSDKSISEIAYKLGFSDPSHFSKFFKKHEEQTPLQYRRKAIDRRDILR
ncbi:AraC family transcriptional regulator [Allomuricauda sp. NBRC 101325]|uniref:AraC family transcriptional regulator n=1 Tax=Allomuricauda sp. NBRC 101325 TaxID=1113758 RepID=UPI0024A16C90|nr:AraC family transcriptional regulator [Muricauda sp. NBRC 101325]GLU43947.1 hypothetical protein Musp01_15710 [Muricauda sp. NBRC 101325]